MRPQLLQRFSRLLLLLATVVTLALFVTNLPVLGHDSYPHLAHLDQYISLRDEGVTFPRWTPNNFRGFGAANLYFYPPMLYMVGYGVHQIFHGLRLDTILNIVGLLTTLGGILTFRLYLKEVGFSGSQIWYGAMLYMIGPYQFYDAFVRAALPEYMTFVWVPLILISIENCVQVNSTRYEVRSALLSAIGWTLLILTNVPATMVVGILILIYVATRVGKAANISKLWPFAVGGAIALMCTAFYWLPVLHFQSAAQLDRVFHFDSYEPFKQFWVTRLFSMQRGINEWKELVLFPLTLVLFYLLWRSRDVFPSVIRPLLVLTSVTILMHIPLIAGPISDAFRLVHLIQFPSRFYLLTAISIGVFSMLTLSRKRELERAIYIGVISVVTVVVGLFWWKYQHVKSSYPIEKQIGWNLYEYAPVQAGDKSRIDTFTTHHASDPEVVALRNLRSDEYLRVATRDGMRSAAEANLDTATPIRFHRFYWPQWSLKAGTIPVPVGYDSNGVMTATIPAGRYRAELSMTESESEVIGARISIAGFFTLLLLFITSAFQVRRHRASEAGRESISQGTG